MKTRRKGKAIAALAAGVLLGLASHEAAAMDVVVAYGDDIAQQARVVEQEFQARMSDYQQVVEARVKANLSKELERIAPPRLEVVLEDEPTLG